MESSFEGLFLSCLTVGLWPFDHVAVKVYAICRRTSKGRGRTQHPAELEANATFPGALLARSLSVEI